MQMELTALLEELKAALSHIYGENLRGLPAEVADLKVTADA